MPPCYFSYACVHYEFLHWTDCREIGTALPAVTIMS